MLTHLTEERRERAEELMRLEERKIAALRDIANQLSLIAARLPEPQASTPAVLRGDFKPIRAR